MHEQNIDNRTGVFGATSYYHLLQVDWAVTAVACVTRFLEVHTVRIQAGNQLFWVSWYSSFPPGKFLDRILK